MQNGNPSIFSACKDLPSKGANQFSILPLYPQYSQTTIESTFDVLNDLKDKGIITNYSAINYYHDGPNYIQALENSIKRPWDKLQNLKNQLYLFIEFQKFTMKKGLPTLPIF